MAVPQPLRIALKVVPRASKSEIVGWLDGRLKIRVAAAPEAGRANAAVERLLADALGVPSRSVRIVAGTASPLKTAEIDGVDRTRVERRLGRA